MLNILLFGPPGSGKGTQSKRLIQHYNLNHLSTGDILRKEIAEQTPLGRIAQHYIDKGELVPDEVVISMIEELFEDKAIKGFVFDGFPRTVPQAKALDNMLLGRNKTICIMVVLEVDKEELIKRLLNRASIEGRKDDELHIIENRIKVYQNQTAPVLDYYLKQGKAFKVNGMQTEDEVFKDVCYNIDNFSKCL
ncbi:MAG TPA: adenylate kinase [Bacteroidales bacterium]|jgi:adenylate kinase|nr:adenylate kinase [Bacteroidales bacterium]HOU98976.1 adenylate kinase [Bacteroidales bacterium]